jgi:hypothetical protein
MGRLSTSDRDVMRRFWRAHMDGWNRSDLNQREYCEIDGPSDRQNPSCRCQGDMTRSCALSRSMANGSPSFIA